MKEKNGIANLDEFDPINHLMTLSLIPLSGILHELEIWLLSSYG
jgi:hypothetical protein